MGMEKATWWELVIQSDIQVFGDVVGNPCKERLKIRGKSAHIASLRVQSKNHIAAKQILVAHLILCKGDVRLKNSGIETMERTLTMPSLSERVPLWS